MRIDFYHLQKQSLEEVLPKLLEKAYQTGAKTVVKIGNEQRVEFINTHLWTYNDQSFLPHGSRKDGNAPEQPIWLTADDDNPNQASLLFLVDGAQKKPDEMSDFNRVFNIFDGNSEAALTQARNFWKSLKSCGAELHYWQQDDNGRWSEK